MLIWNLNVIGCFVLLFIKFSNFILKVERESWVIVISMFYRCLGVFDLGKGNVRIMLSRVEGLWIFVYLGLVLMFFFKEYKGIEE